LKKKNVVPKRGRHCRFVKGRYRKGSMRLFVFPGFAAAKTEVDGQNKIRCRLLKNTKKNRGRPGSNFRFGTEIIKRRITWPSRKSVFGGPKGNNPKRVRWDVHTFPFAQ